MLLKDEVGMLRRVPLFSGVAPAKLKLLAFTSDRVSYAPGQMLFHQGDDGDAAYVVLSGNAEVMVDSAERPDQGRRSRAEFDRRRDRHPVRRVAHRDRARDHRSRRCASARIISCGCSAEFPEMTVEIMRVLADRLSHTTAELTEERSKHRVTQ